MGQISDLSDSVSKTMETVEEKANKAVAAINEASSNIPKDKVEIRKVLHISTSLKQFAYSIIFIGFLGLAVGWYVVKEGRDKSIENLKETLADKNERIKELEAQLVKPKPKAKSKKNK
jgi:uncharacterized protein YoxC